MAIIKSSEDFTLLNIDKMSDKELDDWIDYNTDNYLSMYKLSKEDIFIDNKDNLNPIFYQSALLDLYTEGRQSAQGLYHNLNTLESRQGSQVPFTSINLGRDKSTEGRLVTQWLLEASIDGIGKFHRTSIFPISIFQYKKGVNAEPGTKNYDLKQIALKSMSKRIYPNWVNCDWSQAHEDENNPDTFFSTMGCVDGNSMVLYGFNDEFIHQPIENMWDKFSDIYEVKHQYNDPNNVNLYIDLNDVSIEDFDFNKNKIKYSKCYRLIRNVSSKWIKITFSNGTVVDVTEDHPFETRNNGVIEAKYLSEDDLIYSINENDYIHAVDKLFYSEEKYSYDVTTDSEHFIFNKLYSHNCRTLIGFDRHGYGYIRQGRGNNAPNTIILPKLGIEYGICLGKRDEADLDGFWNALDDALRICEKGLLERYEKIKSQSPKSAPFMYLNNTIKDADKCEDTVEPAVKHNTLAIGLIGVAEMCVALFGKNHAEDEEVHKFALSVVKHIYDYAKEASDRNDLNFGCYFTPAEGLCRTALVALRKQYGVIKDVTSHEFITNSTHVPVWCKVSIYDKLRIEAPFTKYATSGCITYIELESTFVKNLKAVEDIIDYAFNELDIPYLAFNFPIDTCLDCGYQDEFNEYCPECKSANIEQLRRVTGYLTTDYRNFNDGKIAEVKERIKHSAYTDFGEE